MPIYTPSHNVRSVFVTGLQNAHAVERQSLALIDRQLDRLTRYPEVADRLRAHRVETEGQLRRLEEILHSLSETHSSWRDAALSLMGNLAALSNSMAGDEVLKNHIVNHAFENFEIASYTSLIAIAEAGDFAAAVPLLEASLSEEQAMASWVLDSLADLTLKYVGLSVEGRASAG
ncbi:MAG TPA: ferritin-like domain-containing protein [Allosphingosinicella sp.]|nr:ferritin-like domain-containing protein [Allosphingosinicella sp.]